MSDWDRQTTPGGVEGPQWVSAAEAADVAGVTPGTVRYWARNGLIVSEVVEGPAGEKTLVRLDEVLQHARQETPSRTASPPPRHAAPGPAGPRGSDVVTDLPARTSELAPILESIPEIMGQLTAATDRAARAETKVEFLSAQLADLRTRLAEAEAGAGPGPPSVVTLPEEWEPQPAEAPAAETAGTEWPAPAPETLRDEPAEEAPEPGPDSIDWTRDDGPTPPSAEPAPEPAAAVDWTSRDDDAPAASPGPAAASPSTESGSGYSLADIWNQPTPQAPAEPESEEPPAGVDWHEPAGGAEPGAEEPVRTRPANATLPDDDFYGPRRRRWFRRR